MPAAARNERGQKLVISRCDVQREGEPEIWENICDLECRELKIDEGEGCEVWGVMHEVGGWGISV